MYIAASAETTKDWTQHTLIIPSVSVGNVGQLSADLLISTLSPTLVGYFHSESVLPVVGNNPYASENCGKVSQLATAIQVFECTSSSYKLVILQQRAPCIKGRSAEYVKELLQWIELCQFKQVVLLSSMFAQERIDRQITGSQVRYIATDKARKQMIAGDQTDLIQLESRPQDHLPGNEHSSSHEPFIPGGGIAKQLFSKCSSADIAAVILLVFCSEGDNVYEALTLSSYVNTWLQLLPPSDNSLAMWKIPSSWRLQFGCLADQILFR